MRTAAVLSWSSNTRGQPRRQKRLQEGPTATRRRARGRARRVRAHTLGLLLALRRGETRGGREGDEAATVPLKGKTTLTTPLPPVGNAEGGTVGEEGSGMADREGWGTRKGTTQWR